MHVTRRFGFIAVIAVLCCVAALSAPASANRWNFETLDGQGFKDGRTTNIVGRHNSTVVWNNQPHVFYLDNTAFDLRHAWWTGARWAFETLDGNCPAAPCANGRVGGNVGTFTSVVVWNNQPHVFYRDVTNADLRHGWWTGAAWAFETLDGNSAIGGRTTNGVGENTAVTVWNNQPHVWYHDDTADDLRHAWWTGAAWNFETLDGNSVVGGRTTDTVGRDNAVTVWNGQPHIWYRNDTNSDLRHAWWTGAAWAYETLDGNSAIGGRVNAAVGSDNSVTVWNNQPHVWYYDSTNADLRHAWWTGAAWAFETLDGQGGVNGRTANDVGEDAFATVWNGQPHVWYFDDGDDDLRHAWWTGAAWAFETLDGNSVVGGRLDGTVGVYGAVTVWNNQPHTFYLDFTNSDLRHAWYG